MQRLQSIGTSCGPNVGGVAKLRVWPVANVRRYPAVTAGSAAAELELYDPLNYADIIFFGDNGVFEENSTTDEQGEAYKARLQVVVHRDTPGLAAAISKLNGGRYLLSYQDSNGQTKLVGSPSWPVRFSYALSTGRRYSERNGYEFTFTAETPQPAPFYLGNPFLVGEGNGMPVRIETTTGELIAIAAPGTTIQIPLTFRQLSGNPLDNARLAALLESRGAGDTSFDWNRPITAQVPGLNGRTVGGTTVKTGLENALFPDVAPVATLEVLSGTRQPGASPVVLLNWSVAAKTNPITSIVVAGKSQAITSTSGTVSTSTVANTNTTFTLEVRDKTGLTTNALAYVVYQPLRFWFLASVDVLQLSDAELSAALRAASGREFSAARQQIREFEANNQYLCFAWVATAGAGLFEVNGLDNNAFLSKEFAFTNSEGYTQTFRLSRGGQKVAGHYSASVK